MRNINHMAEGLQKRQTSRLRGIADRDALECKTQPKITGRCAGQQPALYRYTVVSFGLNQSPMGWVVVVEDDRQNSEWLLACPGRGTRKRLLSLGLRAWAPI